MKLLPDGSVEITNDTTGETKIVKPADLPNYGIPYTEYQKELQAAKDTGIVGEKQVDPMQAISDAMRQGGSQFINKGKTKDERSAIAQEIAKMGGVQSYREQLPLQDLATDQEKAGLTASTDLKSKLDRSLPNFEQDVPGGTGPIAGRLFDIPVIGGVLQSMASPLTREKRADSGQIMALYQQMISGKVVSDAEVQRLQTFLPSGNKSETQNKEDMTRLKNDLSANMELFDIAKREGLTANEAYDKYAKVENGKLVISKPKKSAPAVLQGAGILPNAQQSDTSGGEWQDVGGYKVRIK